MRHDLTPATQRGVARAPHVVLGLPSTATAAEARLAYLDAVR